MKTIKLMSLMFIGSLLCSSMVMAQEPEKTNAEKHAEREHKKHQVKKDVKNAANEVKTDAKAAGGTVKKGAKKVAKEYKEEKDSIKHSKK
jgi:hypothetical protein